MGKCRGSNHVQGIWGKSTVRENAIKGSKARKVKWYCLRRTWDTNLYHWYYFVGNIGPMEYFEDYVHLDSSSILETAKEYIEERGFIYEVISTV